MKILSETAGLERLRHIRDNLLSELAPYNDRAKSCSTCETPGACCLDEHFVNVRISRLEAVAISNVIEQLSPIRRAAVEERVLNVSSRLTAAGEEATFTCPLYEKGTGCLVHDEAKPVPCMIHACYERREDLPPDDLQDAAELAIDKLNARVYGRHLPLQPVPIAVHAILRTRKSQAITSPARNHPAS